MSNSIQNPTDPVIGAQTNEMLINHVFSEYYTPKYLALVKISGSEEQ